MSWLQEYYVYIAIVFLALCSLVSHATFMLFGGYIPLPESVRSALRYAPAAALTGIIVPQLLPWQHDIGPTIDLRIVAAILAIWVFKRTHSTMLLIVSGMVFLWLLRGMISLL